MIFLTMVFAVANIVGLIAGYFSFGQVVGFVVLCVGVWLTFKFVRFLLEKAEGKTGISLLLILGMLAVIFFTSQAYVFAYQDGILTKSIRPFYKAGNTAYTDEDWALAEKNYRDALNEKYASGDQIKAKQIADVVNNLTLALLQQAKNEEAFRLITDAVQSFPYEGGYWMNYLVAAHANGITATDAIDRVGQFSVLKELASAVEKKPGSNLPYLNGIAYNLIYMDMELGEADSVYTYYPGEILPDDAYLQSNSDWEETLSTRLGRYTDILSVMQGRFRSAYGQEDSDLNALITYLSAKENSAV
jgi:hypothetical protein